MFSKLCLGLLFSLIALAPAGIVRADGAPSKDEVVAQVKKCTLDELSAATCATAQKFFHKLN